MKLNIPEFDRRGLLKGLMAAPLIGSFSGSAFGQTKGNAPHASMIEEIGEIVAKSKAENLSAQTHERVTACIVDNIATLTFTVRAAASDPYLSRVARRSGLSEAVILGSGQKAPLEDAAGALSFLVHYAETDDSDFRAELRASPIVMGPALTMAQVFGATGDDLYAAIAAGYSVLGGLAAPFGALQPFGLMSSGFWGAAASAAVASRLMKLSPAQTGNALSLALSAAGGTFQYYYDQTEEKRLILGRAARAGVESALLAADGEHGARHILEGSAGVYELLQKISDRAPDISGVVDVIRRLDGPMYIYPKFYSASSSITPSLEGLHPLVSEGIDAEQIESVSLLADPVLWSPVKAKLEHFEPPSTLIGAKINYAFMTAFFLTHGAADAATIGKADFADERILRLAKRVRFEPRNGEVVSIAITMKDGSCRKLDVPNHRPGDTAPIASGMRTDKFRALTVPILGQSGSAALLAHSREGAGSAISKEWVLRLNTLMQP